MLMEQKYYKYSIAFLYSLTLFLDRLDISIVNIALPHISSYFHISITNTDWVIISYLIALAVIIPACGWLGDYFGLRRIFIFAIYLFTIATIFCGFSASFNQLVFWRFLQGLSGGMLAPLACPLSIVLLNHMNMLVLQALFLCQHLLPQL